MNTAGLSYLGAKAKPTAEAIARWCEHEGIGYEFVAAKGRHPRVNLSLNRRTRMVVFSGSPSDSRVIENVLQNVRKEARFLGWEPRKETPMETPVLKSLSDLPKLAEPEPHSVEIRLAKTNAAPRPPNIKARNEWIFQRFEDGDDKDQIHAQLVAAGWKSLQPKSVYAQYKLTRRQKGFPTGAPRPRKGGKLVAQPEPGRVQHIAAPTIDPLVLAIAEAIAPLIREQLAKQSKALESLKAKADKWDAISGLVRES